MSRAGRSGRMTFAARAVLAICALVASAMAAGGATAWAEVPDCRSVDVPVPLSAGGQIVHLVGEVCYPTTEVESLEGAVQVLVSGTAYGRSYFDFPYQPDTYSYVRAATAAGFTTFNFDRIGIGGSTKPLGTQITVESNAHTIHEAITKLRAGTVDGTAYSKVVIVGHSLGSLITLYEAGTYKDVDAVVASGILHSIEPIGVTEFLTTLTPAAIDPKFLGTVIDPTYITTRPGTRGRSFYYLPKTDPAVVATDEQLKATATVPEAVGVFAQELPGVLRPVSQVACAVTPTLCDGPAESLVYGVTRNITVPVLSVTGQYDALLCGRTAPNKCSDVAAVKQDESTYYTGRAQRCLTVAQLPDAGHDVNLERNAPSWFELSNEWSKFMVENTGDAASCWSGSVAGLNFP